jgi:hypothetical protein
MMRHGTAIVVVMAGHSASKTRVNALVSPAIHVFAFPMRSKTWMPGTRLGMTRKVAAP